MLLVAYVSIREYNTVVNVSYILHIPRGIKMTILGIVYILSVISVQSMSHHAKICGRSNHNGSNGELAPHNGVIPAGHDCLWHIYPESFNIPEVFIVIEEFKLQKNDRFVISKHEGEQLFGPFNGTRGSFSMLTHFLMLDVTLNTEDTPTTDRQFKAYFTTNACFYLMEDQSGTMTSPLYRNVPRSYNITCTWQFRKFKQVTLPRTVVFESFHLTSSSLVIKGSKAQDGIYTGTKLPGNVIAFGETQFVLHLNSSVPGETFSFKYGLNVVAPAQPHYDFAEVETSTEMTTTPPKIKGSSRACGEVHNQDGKGYFAPKNSTMIYGHTCIWTIDSTYVHDAVGVYIVIEHSHLVDDDKFILRKTESESLLLGPYYGVKGGFSIFTDVQKVDAILTTSDSKPFEKRRFEAYYATSCLYSISNNFGLISSPVYEIKPQNTKCTWNFLGNKDTSILSISFDDYSIRKSNLIIDGSIGQDGSYAGTDGPFDILMKAGGNLIVEIDRSVENETFTFSYKSVSPSCTNYVKLFGTEKFIISYPFEHIQDTNSITCHWIIETKKNDVLAIRFNDIHLADAEDIFLMNDGSSRNSQKLLQVTHSSQNSIKGSYLESSNNIIWASFNSRFPTKGSYFSVEVEISEQGKHLKEGRNFTIKQTEGKVDVTYFLEAHHNEQVLLSVLPEQNFPTVGIIQIYDGFSVNATFLTTLRHNKPFYPVASTGSKMMVVANGFSKDSSIELEFKSVSKGCHQVTLDQQGTYSLSGNCNNTCSWTVLPKLADNQELSLHISSMTLESGDVIEVYQLDEKMTHVSTITSKHNLTPNLYLPASLGLYVNITRSSCNKVDDESMSTAFSANVDVIKSCSMDTEVNPGEMRQISSPNYPDSYPFFSHCRWNISTTAKSLYLSFKSLKLASGHCMRVLDRSDQTVNITFSGSSIPDDIFLKSNISVELVASPCVSTENTTVQSSSGNGFVIEVFAIDCGGLLGREMKGTFSTPMDMDTFLCIWNVMVPAKNEIDKSINIISFDIVYSPKSTEKETGLTIYDGPSLRSEIIANASEDIELLSRTNVVIFVYERKQKHKSTLTVNFELRAGNSLCHNGIYMHPDWLCNSINECGDYSDEKNCKGQVPHPPPVPPKPPTINIQKIGVSKILFWSLVPTMFLVGIIASVITAFTINVVRIRRRQYEMLPTIS